MMPRRHTNPMPTHLEGARATPEQRAILVAYCRGMTPTTAARLLGTSPTTLDKALHGLGIRRERLDAIMCAATRRREAAS